VPVSRNEWGQYELFVYSDDGGHLAVIVALVRPASAASFYQERFPAVLAIRSVDAGVAIRQVRRDSQ
jgi:hypothetical protein